MCIKLVLNEIFSFLWVSSNWLFVYWVRSHLKFRRNPEIQSLVATANLQRISNTHKLKLQLLRHYCRNGCQYPRGLTKKVSEKSRLVKLKVSRAKKRPGARYINNYKTYLPSKITYDILYKLLVSSTESIVGTKYFNSNR